MDLRQTHVLDCGCGAGQYVQALLDRGVDARGIEFDCVKVARFAREHPEWASNVRTGDIEAMEFPDEVFDVVLLNEVLEHVTDERRALAEIHRVLRTGGVLVVFSPNRLYPFETHSVYVRKFGVKLPMVIPFVPYVPLRLGQLVFDYVARNYWPGELKRRVVESGFTIVCTDYLWQTFENISGSQPVLVTRLRPILRRVFGALERTPGVRMFGVSQVVIAANLSEACASCDRGA